MHARENGSEAGQKASTSSMLWHYTLNAAIALLWFYLPARNILNTRFALDWDSLIGNAFLLRNCSLLVLFLLRRPAKEISHRPKEWLVAVAGTLLGGFYVTDGARAIIPSYLCGAVSFLMFFDMILAIIAVVSLGWSFGIVPANRGIKKGGPYAVVRHPIYSFYILFDLLLLSVKFSWLNLAVFTGFVVSCYLRAVYEERLLREDSDYQEYAKKTRYMFIPGII